MPGNFYYNPGQSYNTAVYTARGFDALSQGIQDFAQQQRLKKAEEDAQAYQNQKNETILQNISGLTDSHGQSYIDPNQMVEIQKATDPKKRGAILDGLLGTIAYKVAQDKLQQEKPQYQVLQPPVGAPADAQPQQVITGGGGRPQVITPFVPKQIVVPPAADAAPGTPPVNTVLTSEGQVQVLNPQVKPEMAGKKEKLDNGQTVIYDEKGSPHFSAAPPPPTKVAPDSFSKINEDAKALTGISFAQWNNIDPNKVEYHPNGDMTIEDNSTPPKKFSISAAQRDNLVARHNALLASSPIMGGGKPAQPTRELGPSVGNYKAGATYSGKMYFGGDPNDPANWQP